MKLAYVFLGGSAHGSSVQTKILCQIDAFNQNGIDTKGYFFSPNIQEKYNLNPSVVIYPLKAYTEKRKYFRGFYENQHYYNQIREFLEQESKNIDVVFLRHGASGKEYFKLLKQFASKIYLYIPSNSIRENYREKQAAPKTGKVGLAFRWWEYLWYFYLPEKKLIRTVLPILKGVVVFTPEFGNILNNQAKGKIHTIYNRDGADCANVKPRKPYFNNGKIKLLFMKGSSMQQPWSGLERLIHSIKTSGNDRFELYITGNTPLEPPYTEPFVKLTGRLSFEELDKLTNEVDLGVSNLANYLIDFNQTTNLKSRDYYARGLPFIQANSMPDVDGTEGDAYYLNLPNNELPIDMDLVADFAKKMREMKDHPQRMHDFAINHLDWSVTVAELAKILKEEQHFN